MSLYSDNHYVTKKGINKTIYSYYQYIIYLLYIVKIDTVIYLYEQKILNFLKNFQKNS